MRLLPLVLALLLTGCSSVLGVDKVLDSLARSNATVCLHVCAGPFCSYGTVHGCRTNHPKALVTMDEDGNVSIIHSVTETPVPALIDPRVPGRLDDRMLSPVIPYDNNMLILPAPPPTLR